MEANLVEYWPVLMTGVVFGVWLIRLEASIKNATANFEKEIRRLQHQRNEDQISHKEAREATNSKIDRMWEDVKELRTDIKQLLRMETGK